MEGTVTSPPKDVPEKKLDELFHGPLEEFTAARNELAKSLRSDGDAEAADWVKGLQKPSRAAWLVNQLAVRKPKDVRRLLEVGEELRAAQEEMLAGSADREKLREAAAGEREAIDSLLGTAEAIGREHGVGSQILDRVGETLQAATSDPEVAEAIEQGRLTREQRASGIGLVGAATPKAPARGAQEGRPRGGRPPRPPAAGEAPQGGRAQARRRREAAWSASRRSSRRPVMRSRRPSRPSTTPSSTPTPRAAPWTRSSG